MYPEELLYEDAVEDTEGGYVNVIETGDNSQDLNDTDQKLEKEMNVIKARLREMEEETEKIRQIQAEVDKQMSLGAPPGAAGVKSPLYMSLEEKMESDEKSIFVGNVDYGATTDELEQHFLGCGVVNRVSILCNKFDGHPKGFAYIEFADKDCIQIALALDETLFRGRQLKVMPKRTNKVGISTTNRLPRGMRPRGRGRIYSGYRPTRQPSRGRRSYYSPY